MIQKLNENHLTLISNYMKRKNENIIISDSLSSFDFNDFLMLRNIIFNELISFFAIIDNESIVNLAIIETFITKEKHNAIQILYLDLENKQFIEYVIKNELPSYCKKLNKGKVKIIINEGTNLDNLLSYGFEKEIELENAFGKRILMSYFV